MGHDTTHTSFDFDQTIDRGGTHSVKFDARAAVFGDADVTPLWVADMDFAVAPCISEAVAARARHPVYGYTLVSDSLYRAVIDWHAERHDWRIGRDAIMLTPGTLPALSAAIEAFTQPGEGVIIQPPVYGPFAALAKAAGRKVTANPLIETGGRYRIDLDHLERCAADGARLLLLCNPHNPVGRVWNRSELKAILDISRRHGLTIVSDDIHGDLTYSDADYVPLGRLARSGDRVMSAVSPCKTFNIQGLALTALIVPDPACRATLANVLAARRLDNFNPFSLAAAEAAWRHGGSWRDALVTYLQTTRDAVVDHVRRHLAPIRVTSPQAGYLMWLDCRELGMGDAELRRFFIERCRLGLNPGVDFGAGGSGFMRLNIASPRARIMQALEAIGDALNEVPS
ncbi:MAG TPA: PatB family C-S lyase [Rhodanobacteraceae bacterium]|nr:PatB family C-S lyase [Rhodanobacteraceae bacterium]